MTSSHIEGLSRSKLGGSSPSWRHNATGPLIQQKLAALTGKMFDQAYVADQAAGRQQMFDALRAYSASGDVSQLKTFGTTLVLIVTATSTWPRA